MKYNEIVKQFQDNVFGTLTTIRSLKNRNEIWFIGREIQEILEVKNLPQMISNAELDRDEVFVFNKSDQPEFFSEFIRNYIKGKGDMLNISSSETLSISKYSKSITLISESGLYSLIFNSRKPHAKAFKKWVTKVVLPTLRTGVEQDLDFRYISDEAIKHLSIPHQKLQSKLVNKMNVENGGRGRAMDYNIRNCLDHSGIMPGQLKRWAEEQGIPASMRTSGKEVLRIVDMPTASAMSLNDSLVTGGVPYDKALMISNGPGKELYKQMIGMGIKPKELEK
jgi:prophage antirepressor-like protein